MALSKGLLDLKKLSQEFGVSLDEVVRIAIDTLPKEIRLVGDEKTGTSWVVRYSYQSICPTDMRTKCHAPQCPVFVTD